MSQFIHGPTEKWIDFCVYPNKGYFLSRKIVSFECQTRKMTFSDVIFVANYKNHCSIMVAISNKDFNQQ